LQVSCGDFGRRRTFALSFDRETELGEFVIDRCVLAPFDRFFEHKVRSVKRLMVARLLRIKAHCRRTSFVTAKPPNA
jgi:hypothetical protein